ncbi:NlpC/P60 family protein [Fusicatenibacter sp.]
MVDKTMMGDKCAELVRAAMIGALAVTLGNPTAVYAAEEETADLGKAGIEIAGEAAVEAASFCAEQENAESEEEQEHLAENQMEPVSNERDSEDGEYEKDLEVSETEESAADESGATECGEGRDESESDQTGNSGDIPESGEAGNNGNPLEPGEGGNSGEESGSVENENSGGTPNPDETGNISDETEEGKVENNDAASDEEETGNDSVEPEPGGTGNSAAAPGGDENNRVTEKPEEGAAAGPWPGEGEDFSEDPWPGEEEITEENDKKKEEQENEQKEQKNPPEQETSKERREEIEKTEDRDTAKQPSEFVFRAEQEEQRAREYYSGWQTKKQEMYEEKVTVSSMPWLFHTVEKKPAIADVDSWLHVREGKGTDQKIVGILPRGSLCYLLADEDSDWVFVESGDVRGFVCARYLSRGQETEKEVKERGEESFQQADAWVSSWQNKAYTYTYATTRTLLPAEKARGKLLKYAEQFLGNPYVWGGTSLTNGCDCSGFTQQIFANFGYELPRTSRQQAAGEKKISDREARPGDLLFYQRESGFIYHVMIYLGNGKVIHAGSEATGILISDFNYEKSAGFAVQVIPEKMEKIETDKTEARETETQELSTVEKDNNQENIAAGTYLGKFKMTAYCNCEICCGRWAGGPTASGKMPVQGRTVATGVLPFGTRLKIGGQSFVVEDRGTPYGHIDIYMDSHEEALNFGVRYLDVYREEENG